jgi:16S rRNA G966 N2-methylase RsmD
MTSQERDLGIGIRFEASSEDPRAPLVDRALESRANGVALTVADVRRLDREYRLGGGSKVIWGDTIENWVDRGFTLTENMYRTTTFTPMARRAAHILHEFVIRGFPGVEDKTEYQGIEGCTGAGSQTYELAKAGLWVDVTVEQDGRVALYTKQNLNRLGENGLASAMFSNNIETFLDYQYDYNNGRGRQHKWVYLDPDWYGKHYKEKEKPFRFEDMNPNGEGLIIRAMRVAPIVAIKAPLQLENEEIENVRQALLAQGRPVQVYVENMSLAVGEEQLDERVVYFLDTSVLAFNLEDDFVEGHSVLFLEG